MKLTVKYYKGDGEFSHSYDADWEKTEFYCPSCGKQEVWHDTSGGDYYVGEEHICIACEADFYLPNGAGPRNNPKPTDSEAQVIAAIKAALA